MPTYKERFLAACRNEKTDRPPVWIMRQAGRYLPEYMKLREKHSFLDFCRKPELAREVAMQPLRRFELDAAILFSDILVVPEAMGLTVEYPKGGPVLQPVIDSEAALSILKMPDVNLELGYVGDALEAIRDGIGKDRALIGFAGAPYTLATYMVEGGGSKKISKLKLMMYQQPHVVEKILDMTTEVVIEYLKMQIERGADVVQIFDTWAGELSPNDFARFELPRIQKIVNALKPCGAPVIYFVKGVGGLLDMLGQIDADVLGVDWRISIAEFRKRVGYNFTVQGNLDPLELYAPPDYIRKRVREIYRETEGKGHIFNLGHGVTPKTPIEGVEAFVDEVLKLGE